MIKLLRFTFTILLEVSFNNTTFLKSQKIFEKNVIIAFSFYIAESKKMGDFFQNFVAFLEYIIFTKTKLSHEAILISSQAFTLLLI